MTTPTIQKIILPERPGESPRVLPGDELVVSGTAFGSQDSKSALLIGPAGNTAVPAAILSWQPEQIRFRFPDGVGAPGPKEVRVRAKQGTSSPASVTLEAPPHLSSAPVALLPLALQTRFMADGRELWVRALPDTLHVNSHDERLTPEEAALGQRYRDAGANRDDAWLDLTTRFGVPRAEWIVRATLSGAVVIRDQPWARAARTRLLPRRLYAFAYDDAGSLVASQHGSPIPFELPIGPDPSAPVDTDPVHDPGVRWMVDFSEARARGMAVKLRLPDPPPTRIARLVVLGVETALTPEEGARELGDALAAHRYTRGVGFLPEGTPTNVTPSASVEAGAGDSGPPPDVPPPPATESNAAAAAWALGLTARAGEIFGGTPHAEDGVRLRRARRHMNAALWPVTWGYFLEHMLAPVVPHTAIEPARSHFVEWVRGCGPQPVLRIGEQPYGLLPVLPPNGWAAQDEEPPLVKLAAFLKDTLRPIWRASVAAVPRLSDEPATGDGSTTQEDPLLTVLSMQPTSVSFRGRSVLGMQFVDAAWGFIRNRLAADQLLGPQWRATQAALARAVLDDRGLGDWHPNLEQTVFAANYFPVSLPLVQGGAAPRSQPLTTDWLTLLNTAGWEALRQDDFSLDERPLLYLLLRHSLLVAYLFAAGDMEPVDPWRGGETVLYGIDEIDDNLDAPRPDMAWDRLTAASAAGPAKGNLLDAQPQPPLAAVRDSIAQLAGTPVEVLEHAAAETLDLCSHRLDAWISSFAQRRLHATRGASATGGLHLGAYGIVEDIRRSDDRSSAGYVHTPSLAHAAAAAILASGYRSHPEGGGTRHPFGIDLSSQRVRIALSLIDGVRAGQPLGALLGYRFERTLQERGLARFLDDFRAISPLPVSGTAPPSGAVEAVGALNVVDALELHRRWVAAGRVLPAGWPVAGVQAELQAVFEDLDDGVDALGDIFLTEGVFQLALGNAERAAAALQAAARPSATPPELEAIYTPHAGLATIHRLAVLLPGDLAPTPTWAPDPALARRAAAEPRLDAWAGRLLGDPKRVRYRVQYHDPASGDVLAEEERRLDQLVPMLSPLDVVYGAVASEQSQLSELEQRIVYHAVRTRPTGIPANVQVRVVGSRQPELEHKIGLLELMELAQALRATLTGSRPITPDDLSLPEIPGAAVVDLADAEGRANAAEAALRATDAALGSAISQQDSEILRAALLGANALGVPGAVPLSAFGDTPAARADLQAQASVALADVRRRIKELEALPPPAPDDTGLRVGYAVARIRGVFGGEFRAVPRYAAPPGNNQTQVNVSFGTSSTLQAGDPFAATQWFQRLARVRDGAQRLGDTLLYADALSGANTFHFQVAQLPAVAGDRWIALPFANDTLPSGRVSLVAHLPVGPLDPARSLVGLLIEQFTEVLPAPAKTTGLAFHYDQPNAAPPQAIVLAVPPQVGQDWTLAMLEATVHETLDLAKLRMVDLDALQEAGHFVPATYLAFNAKGVTAATDFLTGRGAPLG